MTEVQLRAMVRLALSSARLSRSELEALRREALEAGDKIRASVVADLLLESRMASGVPGARMSGSRFLSKGGD